MAITLLAIYELRLRQALELFVQTLAPETAYPFFAGLYASTESGTEPREAVELLLNFYEETVRSVAWNGHTIRHYLNASADIPRRRRGNLT